MKSYIAKPQEVERKWYVVDAAGKPLGRVASQVASILRGKNKPTFTPNVDCGDYVIVINAEQVVLTGKKLDQKIKHNQVQFSIVHSHMISEGIFVNMSENESCMRSGSLIEYSILNDISLQAWSPLMASWDDGSFIDNPKYEALNKKLQELANKYNVTKNCIAVSWILRHPANIIPIVGTTKVAHLLEIVKAKDIKLTKEEWYSLYLSSGHMLP